MVYHVKVSGSVNTRTFTDVEALAAFLRSLDVVTEVYIRVRIGLREKEQ